MNPEWVPILSLRLAKRVVCSARAVGRGGAATANLKRYDISPVYHKSVTGGHPKETLEASFDIVQDESGARGYQLESEAILSVCRTLTLFSNSEEGMSLSG